MLYIFYGYYPSKDDKPQAKLFEYYRHFTDHPIEIIIIKVSFAQIIVFSQFSKGVVTTAISLLLTAGVAKSFANNDLPDLGTAAVNTFSLEKEMVYGDAYMRVIRSSAPVISDPVLNQYLSELGNKLVAHATGVKTPFYFFLLRNDEINAFAFFGGHVGVHTGLFLHADTESELASVLAHEITHGYSTSLSALTRSTG